MIKRIRIALLTFVFVTSTFAQQQSGKMRTIVTTDGEIDDECSMVRFLLYTNEWDVEGIITSSSQYHWQGHKWAGDDWMDAYLDAYKKVYPNLVKHDNNFPTPKYLRERTVLGNVKLEGEMDETTAGSQLIVNVLLDKSDTRPVWLQAWGGTNTIARALKTIEQEHPDRITEVANKMRFFFIWEQDSTYQSYIRPHWGNYNIQTIISDQFWAVAYQWDKIVPADKQEYFKSNWMKANILEGHGPLCALYKAHVKGDKNFEEGDFRSEGDSPAFIYLINTGLRSTESPSYGGWGGRYSLVRDNTWLDPVPEPAYQYPAGRWYTKSAWGRQKMLGYPKDTVLMKEYFKPIWRWTDDLQNDFAARADWCVKSYKEANHSPVVKLQNDLDMEAKPGNKIQLSAKGTYDPDDDKLNCTWWQYEEADGYRGTVAIQDADKENALFIVPADANKGETIHILCEVKDNGTPQLTRYRRVVVTIQ